MTENGVVPMPGLVWRCMFTSLKGNEEDLVHDGFTIAVARLAHLANLANLAHLAHLASATKEKKDAVFDCFCLLHHATALLVPGWQCGRDLIQGVGPPPPTYSCWSWSSSSQPS